MKLCTIWIFDVGRGLCAAIRTPSGKWIMIDLGSDDAFCPVKDFLLKHLSKPDDDGRYRISQLIISHPHNDHLSAIKEFDTNVNPSLLTVPNDNVGQDDEYKINWDLITNQDAELTDYLRENMLKGRNPPLKATTDEVADKFWFKIYYLKPGICEDSADLEKQNYTNNLSIIVRLNYKGKVILFCGDMMKDGMAKLLIDTALGNDLAKTGVDFLVAPHHGLKSSFSTELFAAMKGGKPQLNIISERLTSTDSNEQVDDRYASSDYSIGHYVHTSGKREKKNRIKTSAVGHVRIALREDGQTMVVTGPSALQVY